MPSGTLLIHAVPSLVVGMDFAESEGAVGYNEPPNDFQATYRPLQEDLSSELVNSTQITSAGVSESPDIYQRLMQQMRSQSDSVREISNVEPNIHEWPVQSALSTSACVRQTFNILPQPSISGALLTSDDIEIFEPQNTQEIDQVQKLRDKLKTTRSENYSLKQQNKRLVERMEKIKSAGPTIAQFLKMCEKHLEPNMIAMIRAQIGKTHYSEEFKRVCLKLFLASNKAYGMLGTFFRVPSRTTLTR